MRKSTAAISLVLIGSALGLGGCSQRPQAVAGREDEERERSSRMGRAPILVGPRAAARGSTGATVGGSTRGGFGWFGGSSSASA